MSANDEPKLKRVKLSFTSPTNDETSLRNVFCAVKFKRKYKKKPQADSELGKISFFVELENPQQYLDCDEGKSNLFFLHLLCVGRIKLKLKLTFGFLFLTLMREA